MQQRNKTKEAGFVMTRLPINGILLLDKSAGFTSNGILQIIKRLFRAEKAGHTGSLDPIATGMLPICFGEATKFSQFLLSSDKSYRVTAQFGVQTTTGDSEGEVIRTASTAALNAQLITEVAHHFLGESEQIPPMYSAIKHQGKPLYELARKGIEIERAPRKIIVTSLEVEQYEGDQATFLVHCSKGTYIRTLVEDIGNRLGCGAHVIALRRMAVSPYRDALMYTLPALEAIAESAGQDTLRACLLPIETALHDFPAVKLSQSAAYYLRMGQPVRTTLPIKDSLVRLMTEDEKFIGVGEVLADGRVKPHRLVVEAG